MGANPGLDQTLHGLMSRYRERVPDAERIINALLQRGVIDSAEDLTNDHVAFRTIGVEHLGIASLEKLFLAYGYERRDKYRFDAKKLDAYWYSPPEEHYPRIFISELCVDELSSEAQDIIRGYTQVVKADPVDAISLDKWQQVNKFLHSSMWELLTWEHYDRLMAESEYAAWALYNRYYLNHFTISVHDLIDPYNTLEAFNHFLESIGIQLNDSGGKIKISPDGLLKQSSTVAQVIHSEFRVGKDQVEQYDISGSYVEFAERLPLAEHTHLPKEQITRAHRRDGFEAENADRIFESTYTSQTKRDTAT
jgi:hypothetical protein